MCSFASKASKFTNEIYKEKKNLSIKIHKQLGFVKPCRHGVKETEDACSVMNKS